MGECSHIVQPSTTIPSQWIQSSTTSADSSQTSDTSLQNHRKRASERSLFTGTYIHIYTGTGTVKANQQEATHTVLMWVATAGCTLLVGSYSITIGT